MKTIEVDDYFGGRYWLFSMEPYYDTGVFPCLLGTFQSEDACLKYVSINKHEFPGGGFNIFDIKEGRLLYEQDRPHREVQGVSC